MSDDMIDLGGMVRVHRSVLEPALVDIDSVCPHPENYNNGDIDAISKSAIHNGVYQPIKVQKSTGYILAGNGSWEAYKSQGATKVPVILLDVDDTTGYRIMVDDNHTASLAKPDNGLLLNVLQELDQQGGLMDSSYTARDLEVLEALAEIPMESEAFAQWPTLSFKVPPHVKRAFEHIVREAAPYDDREQFELLLRLAGWDGS